MTTPPSDPGPPLRLVFCGTPEFAVPTLEALSAAGHEMALVLTQPDRPSGRGMQLVTSPVKQWALAHGLAVEQPEKLRTNEALRARLAAIAPDAIVVVAYGRILPAWMLTLPRLGNINLHGSLLPKYRGAAPIQWAVANGEPRTGITTMLLEEGLDTGPTLERLVVPLAPDATAVEVFQELAVLGAPLLVSTLRGLADGSLKPVAQDHSAATLAPVLTREDGRIDFARPAREIYNRWRGFQPWPGAWALLDGKKFTVTQMGPPASDHGGHAPGVVFLAEDVLHAACAHGAIQLLSIQLEGKRAVASADFLRGHPDLPGKQLT